jgi:sarcosine oxidase subunit gamma
MPERFLQPTRELPLAGQALAIPGGRIEITPVPSAVRYILRCAPGSADAVGGVFGTPIPIVAGAAAMAGSRAALWLGPDEWLLLADEGSQRAIETAFASLAAQVQFSLVEVSHRNMAVELNGSAAADVLSTACALDLDADVFGPGRCARTLFGKCEVVLWRTDHQAFRLDFPRSYAGYVWQLLEAACADIGGTTL